MDIFVGSTNYGASYKLDRLITSELVSEPFKKRLIDELTKYGLIQCMGFDFLFVTYNFYKPGTPKKFFPVSYLRDARWRHLKLKREYVVECDVDLSDWSPRSRLASGLTELPAAMDAFDRFYDLTRIIAAQIALEFNAPEGDAEGFLGCAPVKFNAICTTATRKQHAKIKAETSSKPNRFNNIPLEIKFPLEFDRATIRSLLERSITKARLGRLDGWSSGPGAHELGYLVKDSSAAIQTAKQTLAVNGYDVDQFTFEASE